MGTDEATWGRVGYAAWNQYHAGKPARAHRVTPALTRDERWHTACGMTYANSDVADAEPHDARCKRCEARAGRRSP